ncbi:MAG TPA: aminoacyl-tRNA hydrolase [Candidatus Dormibacteraeota bacterium]|nr:aminoacyl-tRNA hydrolase [Candidatus Dormibacteraeota bacterium]
MSTLVIGLGNPGGEYASSRHNVGWRTLAELERRGRFGRERKEGPAKIRDGAVDGLELVLARPTTYMNLSGRAGRHLTSKLGIPPEDVIVVHDDMDLPLGRLRLRRGGSAGGQRGVRHLIDSWQTQDFMRVRVGISRPPPGIDPVDWVLMSFDGDERERLPGIIDRAADAVVAIVREGLEPAMNLYNRAPDD